MRRILLFVVVLICCDFLLADLCQPVDVSYTVGRSQTLLDVDSETISSLQNTCYKQFNINGAVEFDLIIDEVSLGGNKYFTYGNQGIGSVPLFDKVFVSSKSCSALENAQWTELKPVGIKQISVQSSVLCFKFVPTKKAMNLGSHMRGHRVRVSVAVNLAVCSQYSSQNVSGNVTCHELCNATGVVKACSKIAVTTRPSTPKIAVSSPEKSTMPPIKRTLANSVNSAITSISSIYPSVVTMSAKNTTVKQAYKASTKSAATPFPGSSILKTTGETTIKIKENTTLTTVQQYNQRDSSNSGEEQTTATLGNAGSGNKDMTISVSVMTALFPTGSSVTGESSTERKIPSYRGTSSTSSPTGREAKVKSDNLFGLVNGLYILVGCVLTIIVVVIVSCCIFRLRKYRIHGHGENDGQTQSSAQAKTVSESYSMPWRDNWLVRHHSVHRHDSLDDEDVFGQSERALQMIHGNFVHQSNPELHLIHTYETSVDESTDKIYDNAHYLLKLNKDDFDAKVKDVLRKQRLLSITSYDLSRPIQRRRTHTLSESSQDSRQSFDYISQPESPDAATDRENRFRKKCQRSSSSISSKVGRSERVARVTGRRRTISQRSQSRISDEEPHEHAQINDRSKDKKEGDILETLEDDQLNISMKDLLKRESSSDTQSSQMTDRPNNRKEAIVEGSVDATKSKGSKVPTMTPMYPVPGKYGAIGTMQFKK